METKIRSEGKEVIIGDSLPTVLIGERINPTGKDRMAEALKAGNLEFLRSEAIKQIEDGADVIDVNVATFGVEEIKVLPRAVEIVADSVDAPICIDSPDPESIEAALKLCRGKPLINSVTGESESLERVLPLIKEYQAAVVGLLQDDRGIPGTPEERVLVAHSIIERADALGIPHEDIIIDCLTTSVSADPGAGLVTLETIRRVKEELGLNITLGASNVSFGLPDRSLLNDSFVSIAIAAGATCLIVDPAQVRNAVLAADLLVEKDNRARRYIAAYRQRKEQG